MGKDFKIYRICILLCALGTIPMLVNIINLIVHDIIGPEFYFKSASLLLSFMTIFVATRVPFYIQKLVLEEAHNLKLIS